MNRLFKFLNYKTNNTVKIGILLGFTGPIESITPDMASGAELAFKEVSKSNIFLGGKKIEAVRADSTCTDSDTAVKAAKKLIEEDKVIAIVGADCSGVTGAVASQVTIPNNIVLISPSSTSPGLSTLQDNKLFFRTAPSDARGGEVLADITAEKNVQRIVITYVNNDYGVGLADVYREELKKKGIEVFVSLSHQDNLSEDYYQTISSTLNSYNADALCIIGYIDNGGLQIFKNCLDNKYFKKYFLSDGMIGDSLFLNGIDKQEANNKTFGSLPGNTNKGSDMFIKLANNNNLRVDGPYVAESYDAAALLTLAIQAGNGKNISKHILEVANKPGIKIYPGELKKGLKLLSQGKKINYVGASNVELDNNGNARGSFIENVIKNGKWVNLKQR